MEDFNNCFSEILSDMVYLVLEYCTKSVEKIFIHCSNEGNCISSNVFFQKDGKELKRSQFNEISELEQKQIIHSINEKIISLRELCVDNKKQVPTEIKLIYEIETKHLISDFCYQNLYSDSENLVVQDIFDNWFNS